MDVERAGTEEDRDQQYEPIVLARVPTDRPVAEHLERWGTDALNTEACAIPDPDPAGASRWPANVCLSHAPTCQPRRCTPRCPVGQLDEQDGASRFFFCSKASRRERDAGCDQLPARRLDLFPSPGLTVRPTHNPHPTVTPLALLRWLTRLTTPTGGLVLDPFCGSGSTGAAARLEGRRFLGIERDPAHAAVARARITHWDPTAPRRTRRPRRRGDHQ